MYSESQCHEYYRTKNKRSGKTDNEISRIEFHSKKLIQDLNKLNIKERKTFNATFPNINKEFYNHFIRGYFDGDGSISIDKFGNSSFSLAGTLNILEKIQEILIKECNLNKIKIYSKGKIGFLQYGGNTQVPKIGNWLYKNSTIFLKRKKEKFNEIK